MDEIGGGSARRKEGAGVDRSGCSMASWGLLATCHTRRRVEHHTAPAPVPAAGVFKSD